jgi:hypothetical protein
VKIISGGQTGVDRAALDVALKHGVDCGGWCPAGRIDEFGEIPERYPLEELEQGSFAERTLQNVKDSDGTVIIFNGQLTGGTEQTVTFCENEKRPHLLINSMKTSVEDASKLARDFVCEQKIATLNVAGPRETQWSGGYEYTLGVLERLLSYLEK